MAKKLILPSRIMMMSPDIAIANNDDVDVSNIMVEEYTG
jgi:hypothetical protein